MISGALLLSLDNYSSYQLPKLYKKISKKILRVLAALFFWGIFYQLLNQLVTHIKPTSENISVAYLIKIVVRIFFTNPWDHLWFLYAIIGLYLLTPLLQVSIASWKKTGLKIFAKLFFIFGICLPLINLVISKLANKAYLHSAFAIPEFSGYLGYYVVGYYLSKYQLKLKSKKIIFILAGLSAIGTVVGTSLWSLADHAPNSSLYEYLLPNTFFVSIAIFIFSKNYLCRWQQLATKQRKIVTNISQNSFGIYLIHDIFLQIFGLFGVNTLSFHPAFSVPLLAMASFILSLYSTELIRKIPILGKYVV